MIKFAAFGHASDIYVIELQSKKIVIQKSTFKVFHFAKNATTKRNYEKPKNSQSLKEEMIFQRHVV